jgi:hypothetical protein
MSVNHRRLYVLVTKKLLNSPDVIAIFEQVGSEAIPKRVTGCVLGDSGLADSRVECFLLVAAGRNDLHRAPPLSFRKKWLCAISGVRVSLRIDEATDLSRCFWR